MKLILENPFRVLGLPVTATNKQLSKRISELDMFLELGKPVRYDTDFEWLSDLQRNQESIQDAARKIEQPDKKFFHALFWFWDTASADKLALDVLKNGDQNKAVSLWTQVIKGKNLSASNFSSYKNMGTLYLAFAAKGEGFSAEYLKASMVYTKHVLTSGMLEEFAAKVSSIQFRMDQEKLMRSFVDEVYSFASRYIDKPEGLTVQELLEAFRPFPEGITRYLKSKFTASPLSNVEKLVEDTARDRERNPESGLELAKRLNNNAKIPLATLIRILSRDDIEVQLIHDKVALEILDCAIVCSNDDSVDNLNESFVDQVISLVKTAKTIALGLRAKQRIEDSLQQLQEMKSDLPNQIKQAKVTKELEQLGRIVASESYSGIAGARKLLTEAKPHLTKVRDTLGSTDDLYLGVSSCVAMQALNLVIDALNGFTATGAIAGGLSGVQRILNDAKLTLGVVVNLDMLPAAKENYRKNRGDIDRLVVAANRAATRQSSGCFIATAVYGDPNHTQVLRLRKFRDQQLLTRGLGRRLVSTYYCLSPPFANWLKNRPVTKMVIRLLLDGSIRISRRNI